MITCYRGLRVVLHLLVGVVLALLVRLDRFGWLDAARLTQWWNVILLDIFDVRCVMHGKPVSQARLTVANHISWMDIPLIAACEPTRFVAKSEIRHWPIAGWLADAAGTFYIRRGKGGATPLIRQLVPHLSKGGSVVVFPEGTTTDGTRDPCFHPRLFAAAIESGCVVQPVAIRYGRSTNGRNVVPFIGDDDLVRHIARLLRERQIIVWVHYCAPISSVGIDRDALAMAAQREITAALSEPVSDFEFGDCTPLAA